jgi:glycosyltransferase involved in cell wall biosynthesis
VDARLRFVADSDADFVASFPWVPPAWRDRLRHTVQRRRHYWYKLSDLVAEASTLPPLLLRRFDLIHFVDGEHTAQYLPMVTRRVGWGVRTIATYHQAPAILAQVVSREVVSSIDHVTVMSGSQLAWFEQYLPSDRITVVLHGVDTDFFTLPAERRPGARFRCITTGSWQRDWSMFAAIAGRLRDADIDFDVVSGAAPGFEELPHVRVHRGVSDEELRRLYHDADLLLLPLRDATANNALLEGMATGLPVLATDLPALREYASTHTSLFVPHDAEVFADSLRSLRDDSARRAAMSAHARRRAEELSWPNVARRLEALYEHVAAG